MRIEWQIGFWVAAFLLLVFLLWLFSEVLLPFTADVALGYLLNPVADRLERLGFSRLGATLLILACVAFALVLISVLIVPVLWTQLASFIESFPAYAAKLEALISAETEGLSRKYGGVLMQKLGLDTKGNNELASATNDLIAQAAQWAATFLNSLLTRGAALIGLISLLVVTPVVAFYMLLDWEKMIATIDGLVPLRHRETVRGLARDRHGNGRFLARPIACVPLSRRVVWYWAFADSGVRQPIWFHRPHNRGSFCRRRRSDLTVRCQALP
jgi:predicted PurR-regulated permease PerM